MIAPTLQKKKKYKLKAREEGMEEVPAEGEATPKDEALADKAMTKKLLRFLGTKLPG